uniref:Uncharacterized protein n=1 Tax=Zea mays TaxID=4577 RepID=C4J7X8_MAIZE|nr:unknown [Zea mays]ACR37352.1 unknown [Zea mays]
MAGTGSCSPPMTGTSIGGPS